MEDSRRPRWCSILALWTVALVGLVGLGTVPDLSGDWVMLQVYPLVAELPLGGSSSQTSYVVQFVTVEQSEAELLMTDHYCFTVVEDDSPLSNTVIPDAFMAALRPTPRTATLEDGDGETRFLQERYIEVRGAVLEDAANDPLPTTLDDPRVFDQDDDGSPGMTVGVKLLGILNEKIYVVQRVQYALSGVVVSPDRIEGSVDWSDEQIVLDATSSMLMAESSSRPDPDPTNHIFIMLRLQEAWTCEVLREQWREVFGVE